MKKIHHLGIAVKSLAEASVFYRDVLGLELVGEEEVAEQKVRVMMFDCGGSNIELLEPTSPDSPIAVFLEKKGPGIHHIAVHVDNIKEQMDLIKEKNIRMIDNEPRIGAGGHKIAFVHPKSTDGVLLEIVE